MDILLDSLLLAEANRANRKLTYARNNIFMDMGEIRIGVDLDSQVFYEDYRLTSLGGINTTPLQGIESIAERFATSRIINNALYVVPEGMIFCGLGLGNFLVFSAKTLWVAVYYEEDTFWYKQMSELPELRPWEVPLLPIPNTEDLDEKVVEIFSDAYFSVIP